MQTADTATAAPPVSSEAPSAAASSSETSPQPTGEGQQAGSSRQPIRSTALATAARRNKKRKSAVPDGRSKAVVCDQCRTRKTSVSSPIREPLARREAKILTDLLHAQCDLKDPCSACTPVLSLLTRPQHRPHAHYWPLQADRRVSLVRTSAPIRSPALRSCRNLKLAAKRESRPGSKAGAFTGQTRPCMLMSLRGKLAHTVAKPRSKSFSRQLRPDIMT